MSKNKHIPVIDLFAGPGGLGEGFASFKLKDGNKPFKLALSIEKDPTAFQTLKLRSFFRQFENDQTPQEYYDYLNNDIELNELYEKYPLQEEKANSETMCREIGINNYKDIKSAIKTKK